MILDNVTGVKATRRLVVTVLVFIGRHLTTN
jgi:hypothetical protein